jgi:hypothetical protein
VQPRQSSATDQLSMPTLSFFRFYSPQLPHVRAVAPGKAMAGTRSIEYVGVD